jgi:hypothetical protein
MDGTSQTELEGKRTVDREGDSWSVVIPLHAGDFSPWPQYSVFIHPSRHRLLATLLAATLTDNERTSLTSLAVMSDGTISPIS